MPRLIIAMRDRTGKFQIPDQSTANRLIADQLITPCQICNLYHVGYNATDKTVSEALNQKDTKISQKQKSVPSKSAWS